MSRNGTSVKLSKSPLSLVLAQVRFERLESFDDYAPKIQDRLRKSGFPVNKSKAVTEVQISAGGQQTVNRHHWEVLSQDRRKSVVLTPAFLVLQTTAYDRFQNFLDDLVRVTEVVNEVLEGVYVERLGLRYVDAILPEKGDSWRDYLQPGLRGFQAEGLFDESNALRLHQTVTPTKHGTMIVRLMQNRTGAVLPPDLLASHLRSAPELKVKTGDLVTLLDIDHYHERESSEFDKDSFCAMAWELKSGSYNVFSKYAVTDHAWQVWQ